MRIANFRMSRGRVRIQVDLIVIGVPRGQVGIIMSTRRIGIIHMMITSISSRAISTGMLARGRVGIIHVASRDITGVPH